MTMETHNILEVNGLSVAFRQGKKLSRAVDNVSFTIRKGEMLAIVGESGSGKTVTALSLLGLLPRPAAVIEAGTAIFNGKNLFDLQEQELNEIRGNRISMIFQEPMTALNPVLTVGWQITEALRQHQKLPVMDAEKKAAALLEEVGIPDPAKRMKDYPHQLSGGMRQRVMIAIALACRPELLIADEPTTALDVTVQAQIMELLARLRRDFGTAILLITHNLALVRQHASRVAVMYAGSIVELADRHDLFSNPRHPYTRLLLKSVPSASQRGQRLAAIDGQVPAPSEKLPGCSFAPRCPFATQQCSNVRPALAQVSPSHFSACPVQMESKQDIAGSRNHDAKNAGKLLLSVKGLKVHFPVKSGWFSRRKAVIHAVDGIDFTLHAGETLALVGESGCGKTTVGKAMVRLLKPAAGKILLDGITDIASLPDSRLKPFRKRIQMVFQDPFSSLDPRLMVGETIAEGMDAHGISRNNRHGALLDILHKVGLPEDSLTRYPHQFSGGQRQRIGLARALAVQPDIVVCDESTSALDVSVQAQILNLLGDLQKALGVAYIFITHDLSVVGFLADRVAVMYLGKIVETGTAADVLDSPAHPYTKALLAAAPRIDSNGDTPRSHLEGEVPSPINPPSGCPFHPRCPFATEKCKSDAPDFHSISPTHTTACFLID